MPPKIASRASSSGAKRATKPAGRKTTGEDDFINLDTPPPPGKKPRASSSAPRFSIEKKGGYTVNPYVDRNKNKIDVVLHEGGVPSKDAQPQVTLLIGGRTLSVQWKSSEKLFSELQAATQGFPGDSSCYAGYSDTIQLMANAGVTAVDGYHRGPPQLIQLDVECTGNPKVTHFRIPTKEVVEYKDKLHQQFNSMYVVTLKVAGERHGLTSQPKKGGIADFGFLGSQNSADSGGGGEGRGGGFNRRPVEDDSSEESE